MFVQLITFRLAGISPESFRDLCDQIAPQYDGVPGLVSKIFLTGPDDGSYGGV